MSKPAKENLGLADVGAFSSLAPGQLAELETHLVRLSLQRGETLIHQGDHSDAMYLVVSGRFEVVVQGREGPVNEIGPGRPVGEIGFFSGEPRAASVIALRDSIVLRLGRAEFEALCRRDPDIWLTITATLAQRLARATAIEHRGGSTRPRTICICPAGARPVPAVVVQNLLSAFRRDHTCELLTSESMARQFPGSDLLADDAVTRWLNEREGRVDYLFFLADSRLSEWSVKAIRQADLVVSIGMTGGEAAAGASSLNEIEHHLYQALTRHAKRLVLIRPRGASIRETGRWLEGREVAMHHHVAEDSPSDYERLYRFIAGRAIGLVACGGGAYCAAHVGMFQAFLDEGLRFDIVGGTSGGAAMVGALAMGLDPAEIDRRTHDIFVTRGAMSHATWPRYSLLDHTILDRSLARHYTDVRIEDLPIPYFAISTDLAKNRLRSHRSGLLWRAIRASSAIPGLFPPVYERDGSILVDGSLLDNVPVATMRTLKEGPNVVINFDPPELKIDRVDYDALPSRSQLIRHLLFPLFGKPLPEAPHAGHILARSLAVNRENIEAHMGEGDLMFTPPIPPGLSVLDWRRHGELNELAYRYGRAEIARLSEAGHALFAHSAGVRTLSGDS